MGWDLLVVVGCVALIGVAMMAEWRKRKRKHGDGRGNDIGEAGLGGSSHRNIDHDAGSDGGGDGGDGD